MAKGRDKQGREQKKPKKAKKQAQADLAAPLPPLRHHAITSTPSERPAEQPSGGD